MSKPEVDEVFRAALIRQALQPRGTNTRQALRLEIFLGRNAEPLAKTTPQRPWRGTGFPAQVPFDPREATMQVPEWDNLDRGWGAPKR